jgi:hypothetical protein
MPNAPLAVHSRAMRCPVGILAALWWVVAPCATSAQTTPAAETQSAPEAGETKGQLPAPGSPARPGSPGSPALPAASDAAPSAGEPGPEPKAPDAAEQIAKTTTAEQDELRARIEVTERARPLDDSVQRPLDFAKAALERSRASQVAGDSASAKRTQKLAHAAVELADARLRLLRERALFSAAEARGNVSNAEIGVAQRALERERARARELERTSAAR